MFKKTNRALTLAMVATVGVLAPAALVAPASATSSAADDAAVITEWNEIAQNTIAAAVAPPIPVPLHGLYFSFVSIAMHDAVVAIDGDFEPYNDVRRRGDRAASPEVAAATAAYVTLREYFPKAGAGLKRSHIATLADVPKDRAYKKGIQVGKRAAAALISDRQNDGRNATVPFNVPAAPGVWQPITPPGFVAGHSGFITPLALPSATHFDLEGPPALTSRQYAKEFKEVKAYGKDVGSRRNQSQTNTALFWSANAFGQYNAALRGAVTDRGYDIGESARAFALLNTSIADTQISCWREKWEHPFWRPVTAIRQADTDGNPRTKPDPKWTPLLKPNPPAVEGTPPYPDYPSGHACLTGATTNTLSFLFGKRSLDITVPHPTMPPRHYDSARKLDKETMNARIWLGIHFRSAMTDGNRLGHQVSGWIVKRYFEPLR